MKKLLIVFLSALLLQACSFSDKKDYKEKEELYESYYKSILDQDKFNSDSPHFSIKATMDKVDLGYVYEIIVDNPKIAMYDVKIMVVEDSKDFEEVEKMMPSAGILDEQVYNVLPNQSNIEKGYMSGFQLLGEVPDKKVSLEVLVVFNDYRKLNTYKEFISFDLEYKDPDDVEGRTQDDEALGDEELSEEDESVDEEETDSE